jgi:hypothetical protein
LAQRSPFSAHDRFLNLVPYATKFRHSGFKVERLQAKVFCAFTERLYLLMRSAGFQTGCVADFQVGRAHNVQQHAGLETRDTADLEVCATLVAASPR